MGFFLLFFVFLNLHRALRFLNIMLANEHAVVVGLGTHIYNLRTNPATQDGVWIASGM